MSRYSRRLPAGPITDPYLLTAGAGFGHDENKKGTLWTVTLYKFIYLFYFFGP
jgi:hypothetical protein